MSDILEFGLDDNNGLVNDKVTKFDPRVGQQYRVTIATFPRNAEGLPVLSQTPKFRGAKRCYADGIGYYLDKGPEFLKFAKDGKSKPCVVTAVISWPINKAGKPIPSDPDEIDVQPWVMNEDTFQKVRRIHGSTHLGQFDLSIELPEKNAKFRQYDINVVQGNVLASLVSKAVSDNEDEASRARTLISSLMDRVDAVFANAASLIGKELTIEQLRAKAAGGSTNTPSSPRNSDLASNVDDTLAGLLDD